MHVCSAQSVREVYTHPSLSFPYRKMIFLFISYQDIKGLETFLQHKVKCHKCTMGTGYYIYIDVT